MDAFEAIGESHRRSLLELLADGPRTAGELVASQPTLTQPAVSRHLRILRESGLVDVRTDAQRRIYTLRPPRLQEIDEWLSRYRRLWTGHLDALERHLDGRPESRRDVEPDAPSIQPVQRDQPV